MSNEKVVGLEDGKLYQFKLNGYVCSGVYLEPDSLSEEGAFFCNGKAVCKSSEAVQIERMYSSSEISRMLVVTDQDGNTVDFEWVEGVVELDSFRQKALPDEFIGTSVEIRSEKEYAMMLAAYGTLGARIWPWHKGYKQLDEDEVYHTYGWEPCGILKYAGVAESSRGTFKSVRELVDAIRDAAIKS